MKNRLKSVCASVLWRTPATALVLLFGLLLPVRPLAAVDVVTDPVGFITVTIQGTNGTSAASAYSLLGLGMTRPVVQQGTISSFVTNAITDIFASWENGQFNGTNGAHFIEFISGANAGLMDDIVGMVAATKTIYTANNNSALLAAGVAYKIRPHWTLASVFGPNDESGLLGSAGPTTADQILVLNPLTQQYATYFYATGGLFGVGWRQVGGGTTDVSQTVLYLDQGCVVRRIAPSSLTVKLVGAVKLGPSIVPIAPANNFAANVYAYQGTNLTLDTSNLFNNNGNPATSLVGGGPSTADTVLMLNQLGQTYSTYFYSTGGLFGVGWRQVGSTTPMGTNQIPLGMSLVIQRKSAPAFNWVVPAPY